jgi:hypothetical protein
MLSHQALAGSARELEYRFAEHRVRPTFWHHNGSIMFLIAQGLSREFYYEAPREGVQVAGANPGTLLFSGFVVGKTYEGVAYMFSGRCGRVGYRVSGPILDGYRRVLMRGLAPQIRRDCSIGGYVPDILEFELIGQ